MPVKNCSRCSREFQPRNSLHKYCSKTCHHKQNRVNHPTQYGIKERDKYLQKTYGISLNDYNKLLEKQGGKCKICGVVPNGKNSLHVDHDHDNGFIRGILCFNCNDGIGKFKNNKDLLQSAINYLYWPDYLKANYNVPPEDLLKTLKTVINTI